MTLSHDISLSAEERRLARAETSQPLWFDAVLRPHRSLDKRGYLILMGAVAAVTVMGAMRTAVAGAWPVAGFFVLDALIIWAAFKLSFAHARGFETIQLKDDALVVTRVTWQKQVRTWIFDPYWVHVEVQDPKEHHAALILSERGRHVVPGRFLPPEERQQVGEALQEALRQKKSGAPPVWHKGGESG